MRALVTAAAVSGACAVWACPSPALGEDRVFTKIADERDVSSFRDVGAPPLGVGPRVGINESGLVVFTAADAGGRRGILSGDGGRLRTLVTARGQPFQFDPNGFSVNDAGTVVFVAGIESVPDPRSPDIRNLTIWGLYKVSAGGQVTEVARMDQSSVGQGRPTEPVVNNAGTVAYEQFPVQDVVGTLIDASRVARDAGEHVFSQHPTYTRYSVSINDSGTIAFLAFRSTSPKRSTIFRVNGSEAVAVADGADFPGGSVGSFALSDTGTVAFQGFSPTEGFGVYTTGGSGRTEVVNTSTSAFDSFLGVAIDSRDDVFFTARVRATQQIGVYEGPDAAQDRVVGPGDLLDGRVAQYASVAASAVNDRGQLALYVVFDDDDAAVYRADPESLLVPEGAVSAAFVPAKVTLTPEQLRGSGQLDTGGLPFQVGTGGFVTIGANLLAVSVVVGKDAAILLAGDGVEVEVRPPSAGSSRASFQLVASGGAIAGVQADGPLDFVLEVDSLRATGRVPLSGGAYSARSAAPQAPDVFPIAAKVKLRGPGRDALSLTLGVPELAGAAAPPDVRIDFAGRYEAEASAGAFQEKAGRFEFREGKRRITVDPRRGTLSVRDASLDLGSGTPLGNTAIVTLEVGGETRVLSFRLRRAKSSLRY